MGTKKRKKSIPRDVKKDRARIVREGGAKSIRRQRDNQPYKKP